MREVFDVDAVEDVVGSGRVVAWETDRVAGHPTREIGLILRFNDELFVTRLLVKSGTGTRREGPEPLSRRLLRSVMRQADVYVVRESAATDWVSVPPYVGAGEVQRSRVAG